VQSTDCAKTVQWDATQVTSVTLSMEEKDPKCDNFLQVCVRTGESGLQAHPPIIPASMDAIRHASAAYARGGKGGESWRFERETRNHYFAFQ
jgi:hypothetical protein